MVVTVDAFNARSAYYTGMSRSKCALTILPLVILTFYGRNLMSCFTVRDKKRQLSVVGVSGNSGKYE